MTGLPAVWHPRLLLAVACMAACTPSSREESRKPDDLAGRIAGTFVAVADVHLQRDSGSIGYRQDTGRELWDLAQAKLSGLLAADSAPRFVLYLGDLPAHEDGAAHDADIEEVLDGLAGLAHDHDVPIVYVPGNNDSPAGDYCPLAEDGGPPGRLDPGGGWPLAGGNGVCEEGAGNAPCTLGGDAAWGWFAAYPLSAASGLRVVALNTVVLSTNTTCDRSMSDARRRELVDAQFAWLRVQLVEARDRGERVLLAMHVFPGRDGYSGDMSWRPLSENGLTAQDRFLSVLYEHRDVVAGVMTAHSHMDEIRRLCPPEGTCETDPFAVAVSAPGVTPIHDNNPGIKLVSYDVTYAPVDFTTHYTLPSGGPWRSYAFRDETRCPWEVATLLDCVRFLGTDGLVAFELSHYDVRSGRNPPRYPRVMLDVRFGDGVPGS